MRDELTLNASLKGYPMWAEPCELTELGGKGWHVLDGMRSFPLAVLRRTALEHNIAWMQAFANRKGALLAPHGKTTLSPELMRMQLAGGAWGLTLANAHQVQVGIEAGAKNIIIANQVVAQADLDGLEALLVAHPDVHIWFLMDDKAHLEILHAWSERRQSPRRWNLLLEIGMDGQRTGCRSVEQALELAQAIHDSPCALLGGVECYEGGLAHCVSDEDSRAVSALVDRVNETVRRIDDLALWAGTQVLISAGGSAVFDLVVPMLAQRALRLPMHGVLRSGCYVTHDHGRYAQFLKLLEQREGLSESLKPALEVWTLVQSVPEPGLALLTCGRRDISFDQQMPTPVWWAPAGLRAGDAVHSAPSEWQVTALNDQHAYLRFDASRSSPRIGDRVALGVSHPCTTFDRWRWMAVIEDDGRISGAISTRF